MADINEDDEDDGGIDILNVIVFDKNGVVLDKHYLSSIQCNYCKNLLRNAHQLLECGHRYCKQCVTQLDRNDSSASVCPIDNILSLDKDIKPDRAVQRDLLKLIAECPATDCNWKGPLMGPEASLEKHLQSCAFLEVPCKLGCGCIMIREELDDHYGNDCIHRSVSCEYCNNKIKFELKQDHYNDCDHIPVTCENCNEEVSKINLKEHHLLFCPVSVVKCSFCKHEDKLADIGDHYKIHMIELIKLVQYCHSAIEDIRSDRTELQKSVGSLEEMVIVYQKQVNKMESDVNKVLGVENTIKEIRSEIDRIKMAASGRAHVQKFADAELKPLNNQIIKLKQEVNVIRTNTEEVIEITNGFKKKITANVDAVQTIRESISRHAVAIDEVKLRQDILDVKTVNGVFIWKIPELNRRCRDAKDRRTLSLYSPPFHTSPQGYRMCIRAYLNGDGSGKDECVSIFFVLMRSEHDEMLTWPFRRPVTFEILSQTDKVKHISETFMPDDVSPSFQKPEREMNVASGFPKFAKQAVLVDANYAKDDAIFIRCKIDTSGMKCE